MIPHKETILEDRAVAESTFPLIELMLNGNISFDELMEMIHNRFKIPYKLIKADIEYWGRVNYGTLLIQLLVNIQDAGEIVQYFRQKNIKYNIKSHD